MGLEGRSAEQERRQQFPKLSREMPEQNERMKLKALCNKEEDKRLKYVYLHLQNSFQHNLCVVYFRKPTTTNPAVTISKNP